MLTPPPSAQTTLKNRKPPNEGKDQDTTSGKSSPDQTKVRRKKKKSTKRHHNSSSQSTLNSTNNKLIMATGLLTLAGISAFVMYRVFKTRKYQSNMRFSTSIITIFQRIFYRNSNKKHFFKLQTFVNRKTLLRFQI
ncbi:hypothetical protein BCR32DRAFT_282538 [Anaeromyces robustus]|uniref:Uncharacterized protein n=1 Tax=Anaeromyces robustus TaxID=1754192 RepID=A0A1Y1WYJ1_9FUNG|nr:hypothetical protein BCR32DRAFT_282538 [Anaeromyces robustus]|eukprot:ORX78164.1 hypothetical protein BCR32DRAFT_282538 [Anaeromyces robustus]